MMIGNAVPYVIEPVAQSACRIPTDAEELWMTAVSTVPASIPRIGLENIVRIFVNSGTSASGFTAPLIVSIPNISMAKPKRIMPISLFFWLFKNITKIIPITARTGAKLDGFKNCMTKLSLSIPDKLRIQAVTVVPTFAPIMIPIAWESFIIPELTNPTTMTVVADDDWITGMLRRRPFGVIFIFANLTEKEKTKLQANGIPYVIFDPSGEPSNDDFSVQADNWAGGVLATRHLLALGHTRIGIITGPEEMMCSRARLDGYTSALAEQGIALDPELVTEGDFTTEGGYAQAMALLENPNRPTAIFAGSDLQAMGVYEAARQNRLRIPEDLSVVGFDDVQTSAFLGPALTTVRQPLHDMAAVSTRMLIDTAEGRPTQHHVILPTTLVVRGSTARLASEAC